MQTFKIRKTIASSFAVLSIVVAFNSAGADKNISIVTGPVGASYFDMGKSVSAVLNKNLPGALATVTVTNGAVENVNLISAKKGDVGFAQADVAWDGYKGYGKFKEPMPIRAIAVFYANRLHFVTLRDSGINKAADLRGKRISIGPSGSAAEVWALRLLEANGITPDKDVSLMRVGPADAAIALKEGKIDAFMWPGGNPVKAISDLANEPNVKMRLLDTAHAVPVMLRKYGPVYTDGEIPLYRASQLPTSSYPGVDKPVRVAEVWNLLFVHADTDEKFVYDIVKTLFENKPELVAAYGPAKELDLSNQTRRSPIPFHAGAQKYFLEKGIRVLR